MVFGLLCAANAHAVAHTERGLDRSFGVESLAQRLPLEWRSDLIALSVVLVLAMWIENPLQVELVTAAALELALFAALQRRLLVVVIGDLPLYAAAFYFYVSR